MDIIINGEIREATEKELLSKLWEARKNKEDVTILINSGGGDGEAILAAIEIIRDIKFSNGKTVTTICLGYAFSAAAMLLMAGTIGKRFIVPSGEVMIHRGVHEVKIAGDTAEEVLAHVIRTKRRFEDFYTGINGDHEKTLKWLTTDSYFTADQAISESIVDQLGLPE